MRSPSDSANIFRDILLKYCKAEELYDYDIPQLPGDLGLCPKRKKCGVVFLLSCRMTWASYSLRSGYYTTDEVEIIESQAEDILQKIRDRIWTSLEVTQAFCKAAALAQELVCQSLLPKRHRVAHWTARHIV